MGTGINLTRKKDTVWHGLDCVALDGGLKTPSDYGRMDEAFDGAPREGNLPGDSDTVTSLKIDNDRYRMLDVSNMHIRGSLEDYTQP